MRCAGPSTMPARSRPVPTSSASPASRAAAIWPCWSPCGRTIRAMPRSRCRPAAAAQDASVRCVVMSWPVINPFSRYRLAKRARDGANPPEWPKSIIAAPRFLLAQRGQHGGGQSAARARARREGASPRRRSGSRAAATACTTTRTWSEASPATSRSASSPTTARPAARFRWNIIEPSATPATRRICRRRATCSSAWWRSWEGTSGFDASMRLSEARPPSTLSAAQRWVRCAHPSTGGDTHAGRRSTHCRQAGSPHLEGGHGARQRRPRQDRQRLGPGVPRPAHSRLSARDHRHGGHGRHRERRAQAQREGWRARLLDHLCARAERQRRGACTGTRPRRCSSR